MPGPTHEAWPLHTGGRTHYELSMLIPVVALKEVLICDAPAGLVLFQGCLVWNTGMRNDELAVLVYGEDNLPLRVTKDTLVRPVSYLQTARDRGEDSAPVNSLADVIDAVEDQVLKRTADPVGMGAIYGLVMRARELQQKGGSEE